MKLDRNYVFAASKEEEANLVTDYKWPYGAKKLHKEVYSIPSCHRRFNWCLKNLRSASEIDANRSNSYLALEIFNKVPDIPQKYRKYLYYSGENGRDIGIHYDFYERKYFTDERRPDAEELIQDYRTDEAIDAFFTKRTEADSRKRAIMRPPPTLPPRHFQSARKMADFDAQEISNKRAYRKTIILDAFHDLISVNAFTSKPHLCEIYWRVQWAVASHGIDCTHLYVRDTLSKYGENLPKKLSKGQTVKIKFYRQG